MTSFFSGIRETLIPPPGGRHGPLPLFLVALTVVTGLVDAFSYLVLGHVFVANMTGNVVFLGFSVDRHSGLSPVASLIVISGFLVGASTGGRLASRLSGRPHRWLASAIGAEAAFLALVAILTAVGVLPLSGRGDSPPSSCWRWRSGFRTAPCAISLSPT